MGFVSARARSKFNFGCFSSIISSWTNVDVLDNDHYLVAALLKVALHMQVFAKQSDPGQPQVVDTTPQHQHRVQADGRPQQVYSSGPGHQVASAQPSCCIVEEPDDDDDEPSAVDPYNGQDAYNPTHRDRMPKRARPEYAQYEPCQAPGPTQPPMQAPVHAEQVAGGMRPPTSAGRSRMAIQETVCTRTLKGPDGRPAAIMQETVTVTQVHKRLRNSDEQGVRRSGRAGTGEMVNGENVRPGAALGQF